MLTQVSQNSPVAMISLAARLPDPDDNAWRLPCRLSTESPGEVSYRTASEHVVANQE